MSEREWDLKISEVGEHLEQPVEVIRGNHVWARLAREEVFPRHVGYVLGRAKIGVDHLRVIGLSAAAYDYVTSGSGSSESPPEQYIAGQHRDPSRKRLSSAAKPVG